MAASLKEVGEQPNGLGGGLDGALAFVLRAAGAAELSADACSVGGVTTAHYWSYHFSIGVGVRS
jgi:hypothetical protein